MNVLALPQGSDWLTLFAWDKWAPSPVAAFWMFSVVFMSTLIFCDWESLIIFYKLSPWKQKLCRRGFPDHLVLKSYICFSLGVSGLNIHFKPTSLGPINKRGGFPPTLATDPPLHWLCHLYGEQNHWTDPVENEFSNKISHEFSAQYRLCFAVECHKHYWRNKE